MRGSAHAGQTDGQTDSGAARRSIKRSSAADKPFPHARALCMRVAIQPLITAKRAARGQQRCTQRFLDLWPVDEQLEREITRGSWYMVGFLVWGEDRDALCKARLLQKGRSKSEVEDVLGWWSESLFVFNLWHSRIGQIERKISKSFETDWLFIICNIGYASSKACPE